MARIILTESESKNHQFSAKANGEAATLALAVFFEVIQFTRINQKVNRFRFGIIRNTHVLQVTLDTEKKVKLRNGQQSATDRNATPEGPRWHVFVTLYS